MPGIRGRIGRFLGSLNVLRISAFAAWLVLGPGYWIGWVAVGQDLGRPGELTARELVSTDELAGDEADAGSLAQVIEEFGGPDSVRSDPPAADGPPKSFGPPPPPRLAFDTWWIGPSLVEGSEARLTMSFLSIGGGHQFKLGKWTRLSKRCVKPRRTPSSS